LIIGTDISIIQNKNTFNLSAIHLHLIEDGDFLRRRVKKFFWKRYQLPNNGTRLVFTPSCLVELPQLSETGTQFSPIASEVWYDRERLRGFKEEEARIWMKVFRLRHADRWIPNFSENP
jgi:hypothetical protein